MASLHHSKSRVHPCSHQTVEPVCMGRGHPIALLHKALPDLNRMILFQGGNYRKGERQVGDFGELGSPGMCLWVFACPLSPQVHLGRMTTFSAWGHTGGAPGESILLQKTFPCYLQCEEAGGAHSQFQELLSALGKSGSSCSLSIANRLFGEVTFQFLQVSDYCLCGLWCWKTSVLHFGPLLRTSNCMCLCCWSCDRKASSHRWMKLRVSRT